MSSIDHNKVNRLHKSNIKFGLTEATNIKKLLDYRSRIIQDWENRIDEEDGFQEYVDSMIEKVEAEIKEILYL